jgi:histone H2A
MATPKKVTRKTATKATSQSKKAGLVFPVGKIGSALRKGRYCPRVSKSSATYMAGVLEYLTSEVLEVAAKAVLQRGKSKRITPRALTLAVRHDADLGALLKDVTLSEN